MGIEGVGVPRGDGGGRRSGDEREKFGLARDFEVGA